MIQSANKHFKISKHLSLFAGRAVPHWLLTWKITVVDWESLMVWMKNQILETLLIICVRQKRHLNKLKPNYAENNDRNEQKGTFSNPFGLLILYIKLHQSQTYTSQVGYKHWLNRAHSSTIFSSSLGLWLRVFSKRAIFRLFIFWC